MRPLTRLRMTSLCMVKTAKYLPAGEKQMLGILVSEKTCTWHTCAQMHLGMQLHGPSLSCQHAKQLYIAMTELHGYALEPNGKVIRGPL